MTNGHKAMTNDLQDNQSKDNQRTSLPSDVKEAKSDERPVLAAEAPQENRPSLLSVVRQNRGAVLAGALVVLLLVGTGSWFYFASYESTDDAQVDGHLHPVSARISGTILRVNPNVEDNHYVEAGTVLAEIDPADFQADLDRAQADYDRLKASALAAGTDITVIASSSTGRLDLAHAAVSEAEDSVAAERASLQSAEARLAQAEANFKRAEADQQRYQRLLEKHEISQSEYDRVATEAVTDREGAIAARADIAAAQRRIAQAQSRFVQRKADLLAAGSDANRAKAQLTTAQLKLNYTKIIAPVNGIIGRKTVEAGQRVQPGQQLLTIIQLDDVWVTANFKENQLRKMKPGQDRKSTRLN